MSLRNGFTWYSANRKSGLETAFMSSSFVGLTQTQSRDRAVCNSSNRTPRTFCSRCRYISSLSTDDHVPGLSKNGHDVEPQDSDRDLNHVDNNNRQDVDEIMRESEETLDQVADDVRDSLSQLLIETEALADRIITKETQALLDKCGAHQEKMVKVVKEERGVIEQELKKIQNLVSAKSLGEKASFSPSSGKILLSITLLFGLAAFIFTLNALIYSDSNALNNAIVDTFVAISSAYFLSKKSGR